MAVPTAYRQEQAANQRLALVFGATGTVGTNLVPALVRAGWRVRAAARNRAALEARFGPEVHTVTADALRPDTLQAALKGVDTAYYLVHSMAAGRDFGRLDVTAAGHFADAAGQAAVRRIVYLGGLVPPAANSEHLLSRRDTGERLRQGSVPVIELRAGIIVGPGSAAFEVIRDLVNALPVMITPKWVRSRTAPIALDNLLHYLVHAADLPHARGAILDAAGPEYISYEAMIRGFAAIIGKKPRIIPVSLMTPHLSAYWLALVTSVPTPIARALIGGLAHDIPADDAALRRLVPQVLLGYHDAVIAAMEAERQHAIGTRWKEGTFMFRDYRHDYAFYAKRAGGSAISRARPATVWHVVQAIGGDNGYYYMDILWTIRGAMDRVVGGPGLDKGRHHPETLHVGDKIDCWTVLAIEPERRLTLHFGMRAPGSGVLEFELEPLADGGTKITVTAYWHPKGAWGLSYWYAMIPAHEFLFRGMTEAIARRAELLDHRGVGLALPPAGRGFASALHQGQAPLDRHSNA
jgi:uncharacterized protein YbjT (DUF2867 family)